MLTKIKLQNFRSFKKETVIDVTTSNYKILEDSNTHNGVTKGLLFIGGNATGKTNAIYSISFLLDLLFISDIKNTPVNFCMFSNEPEMRLEYTFKFDDDEIVYLLCFNRNGTIAKESVLVNEQEVLNRISSSAESLITENKFFDAADIDPYTPFIKTIYFNTKFTKYPLLARWFNYLSNSVYFNADRRLVIAYNINNILTLDQYLDKYGVAELNKFFSYFNFSQEVEYGTAHKLSEYIRMDSSAKTIYIKRRNVDLWMPLQMESLGNQTLLNMLPAILHCVKSEAMFVVDEFSSAFHNELEELIVRYFMQNSTNSQMFFVSHSTNLLKSSLLRPDQIYTVDFDGKDGSVVKRVSSEHPRESQNLEKMYLSGIFNGLPNYERKFKYDD